ncbi:MULTISPECIES: fimbria/pilus periplasmic chaperone [Enterobacteriaceae]|uniref:fimbria/pilus periplasmic chaperone n=1 Tax=Enterobacteriaceae TaxID=543 RepID=UPI001A1B3C43|nr:MULTISPECIES: fimbria/pilus periplasmic chaperone [Klebsiella]HAT3652292.1 fimbria/pilus periplasmic chaperone [Raoultella ornithinolytica]MDP1292921.1 fimbria/pilus periplasmic chaperone [Klebsiella variicola]MDP1339883.1 fimbria/pilus periplasmic chaperone [Klebsiella variicola]QUE99359.1 fimbria/pilus periplasmic chaperone [Klebsiella pasteurii]HCI9061441.1 fimbria/pilus periplasmic chaperone [Klebsiella quasipneumoniae]
MMLVSSVLGMTCLSSAQAAIALDRTRAIISGNEKSISLNISNENKQLPYLAQGWIENDKGEKITSPFTVLPPVQRIEPGARSQVKIQVLPDVANLPKDRESVFYFNLREIPPKSDKPNTLQIALQTRIKLFYRPDAIVPTREQMANPWQENLTLIKEGDQYKVNNPTPYNVILVDAMPKKDGKTVAGFEPIMIAPKSSQPLRVSASALGNSPVLTYINDYGGRPTLSFNCQANQCQVVTAKK